MTIHETRTHPTADAVHAHKDCKHEEKVCSASPYAP